MTAGDVFSRERFIGLLHKMGCKQNVIDDWKNDNRGNHTVHIVVIFGGMVRCLWYGFEDLWAFRRNAEASRKRAEGWHTVLMEAIDSGLGEVSLGRQLQSILLV